MLHILVMFGPLNLYIHSLLYIALLYSLLHNMHLQVLFLLSNIFHCFVALVSYCICMFLFFRLLFVLHCRCLQLLLSLLFVLMCSLDLFLIHCILLNILMYILQLVYLSYLLQDFLCLHGLFRLLIQICYLLDSIEYFYFLLCPLCKKISYSLVRICYFFLFLLDFRIHLLILHLLILFLYILLDNFRHQICSCLVLNVFL